MTTTTAAPPSPVNKRATAPGRPVRSVHRKWTEHGLVFVAPFLVVYAMFLIWPLLSGLGMSMTSENITGTGGEFVGLDNYAEAVADPDVWSSLWNTVWFTVLSTVPLVLVGLGLALLSHQLRVVQWLWRLSWFAPFLLPSGVVCLLFAQMIFPSGFGLADQMLAAVGLEPGIGWLSEERYAMLSIVATTVWWTVGFNFLLYLAALQAIPVHLYEAAELDGAGAWNRLWHITLPMLRRTTGLVVVLQVLASLKIFDQVYIMTGGGPDESTRPILQYVYQQGFTGYRIGYASAVSYIFFALILIVSLVQPMLSRRRAEEAAK
ncbi:carbohydrate ABC transporter permease [Streptomyces pristinaespiralis]|uniref:Integral membrane binding-protein-dependent transporter n=2 Tax=Streptomyces pristinaespiralis TaxID=38300 RepID=D6X6H9_STRE2|nr:sugar ABC transporter permease [Streptomyces pristinaespiralis]ALC24898.1 sugar ABC transporter permease [Streptomyces pristinaespiralis]EFH32106.1 integral membrane binding-protein-dependent transporter [Streptomyces pristinaespiralis ATCC 25486]QMU12811.1 sugar ABC transporter permease [Streptomyces pristinaespiralis]